MAAAVRKYSRQREIILHHLGQRKDHPTAEMIYLNLKENDPRLSLGTVYRNLALLTDEGRIRRIGTGEGPDRFDGDLTDHDHFICRSCHRIFDLHRKAQLPAGQEIYSSASRKLTLPSDNLAILA